jgi:VWFA-related protein
MRLTAALVIIAAQCCAQFKSSVPLVVAPTTVTDSKGHFVEALDGRDLVLYDNNVPQKIQMDWTAYPIDLVVAVQTSANSGAVIDKLGGSGILFAQLLAGDAGETAVISFSDEVKIHQEFTGNPDSVVQSLRMLRKEGEQAHILDAMGQALAMLEQRPPGRRRIVFMIAERRDRASAAKLPDVMEQTERLNAAVYWLTYSPFLEPFTAKPKTAPDGTELPPDIGPGNYIYAIHELIRLHQPDLASLFSNVTGGRTLSFLKKGALEHAIQLVSEEIHRQYVLTFQPRGADPGRFHRIRVVVKDRAELHAKTRDGYWALQ